MDARHRFAYGLLASAFGFTLVSVVLGAKSGFIWLIWGAYAIVVLVSEEAFGLPVTKWEEDERWLRYLPSVLLVIGIFLTIVGVGTAIFVSLT